MSTALKSYLPPHQVVQPMLSPDAHDALRAWVLAMEPKFRPSRVIGRRLDPAIRHSVSFTDRDYPEIAPLREAARALLPLLFAGLGMAEVPIDRLELELVAYGDGAFYGRHRDVRIGDGQDSDRILSGVYYFHAEPKAFEGGALRLHRVGESAEGAQFVDIAPLQNSFAVFPSWVQHEVLPVRCPSGAFRDSRFAINCWFRRNRAQTA